MRARRRWALGLGLLALALWAAYLLAARGKPVRTVTVTQTDLQQTVAATGRVNAAARVDVASEVTATVAQVLVREGDRVRPGQLLVRMVDDEALAALAQAQSNLREAQVRQKELVQLSRPVADAGALQAQAALEAAQRDLDRSKALVARGFYAQQRLDEAERAFKAAQAGQDAAAAQRQANAPAGSGAELLQTRLSQAQAAVAVAQAKLQRLHLRAPMDAVVLTRAVEPGTLAQPGRVLLSLAAAGPLRVDAAVDEKHLAFLRPGMPAKARADAFAGQSFDATLDWLAPAVDARQGTVEVRLGIPQPPPGLRLDMTVSVDILGERKRGVLTLPAVAVRDLDRGEPWVLVVREGSAQRQKISVGMQGVGSVEVLSGLSAGDAVIPQTEKAVEGDRVRVLAADAAKPRPMEVPQGMVR